MSDDIDYRRLATEIGAMFERREEAKPSPRMSASDVEDIARRAAKEAVEAAIPIAVAATLINFGLDPNDRQGIQRDMLFIRDMRTLSADSKKHVLFAVLSAATVSILTAVYFYVKSTGKG